MLKNFNALKFAPYLILLILTLPLERIPSLEFYGYTIKLNQIAVIVLIIAFLIQLKKKKIKLSKNILIPLLLLFLGAGLLSFTNAVFFDRAIIIWLTFVFVAFLFAITPSIINDKKTLEITAKYLFIITIAICVFGLYQYLGDKFGLAINFTGLRASYSKVILGFPRIQSTLIEPLYLANFLIIPGSLFLALFLSDQIKTKRIYIAIVLTLFFVVLALTVARSGYLGLAIAFLVIILFRFREFFTLKKFSFLISCLIFSGLIVLILLGNASNRFFSHSQVALTKNNQEPSAVERQDTYSVALRAFKDHPILGIGIGNFGPYYAAYPSQAPENGWQTVNNEYLEILAETGIFGLLTFIVFILTILFRSWLAYKKSRDKYLSAFLIGSTAALIGILVQYYFFSTLYIIYIWFLMGLIVAIQEIIFKKAKEIEN